MAQYRQKLSDFLPIFLLVISVLIFFREIIYSSRLLFGSDFVLYFHPVKKFIRDYVLTQGMLPFWNPYLLSGTPFISNIQAAMFYPLGFLFYIVPAEYAYGYTIILHCVLGSIFMYVFIRSLAINKAGALLAAIIFTYNGFFMAHLYAGHLSFVQNYIWIPLIFCFMYKFLKTTHFKWTLFAGLALGIQILGGFPQIAFYTILGILAFGLFHMGISLKARHIKDLVRIGLGLVILVSVGFSFAAIQVLPTLEFMRLSGRSGGVSYWFATFDSLHPKMFLSFLIPDVFGSAVDQTYWLGPRDWYFWETCAYVGILPLCLIFISIPKASTLRNVRYFFAGLIVLALFLALGKYNLLYPLIYNLPGFHSFRIPAQSLFLYVFGVAVLSGIAMHHTEEGSPKITKSLTAFLTVGGLALLFFIITMHFFPYDFFSHLFKIFAETPIDPAFIERVPEKIGFAVNRSVLLFFTAGVVLILFYKKKIGRALFKVIVLAMVMMDLGLYSFQFIKPYEFITSKEKQGLINQLRYDSEPGRILTSKSDFLLNDGLLYHFPSIDGYDPLILKRYILYLQVSQQLSPEKHVLTTSFIKDPNHKFLKMLNLKYIVKNKRMITVDTYVPRAIIVNRAVVKPAREILDFMMTDNFDPSKMVVFEPESKPFMLQENNSEDFEGSCLITYYDNEQIRIKTSANQACYLVLSEIFYPGWGAKVDGRKAPILRGNYLFRVIPLEQGKHEVHLRFVSWPFRIGVIISLLILAGSLWFIVWKRK
ncbi:MAG: YfhO family protein [Desulfobacterales bacterium]|nr:YfhO family protein [Desulfobacterales bacterium]